MRCRVYTESIDAYPRKDLSNTMRSKIVQKSLNNWVKDVVQLSVVLMLNFIIMRYIFAGVPSHSVKDANALGSSYSVGPNQLSHSPNSSAERRLSVHKDISEIIKNYGTFIAVIIGGVWAYIAFVRRREKYPSAKVNHKIFHRRIDESKAFLKVVVIIQNVGEVIISLDRRLVRVQQMIPWPIEALKSLDVGSDCTRNENVEVEWPLLAEVDQSGEKSGHEIEPGESDELHFDFVINSSIDVVVIYSYLRNVKKHKREIGWNTTSIYRIKDREEI